MKAVLQRVRRAAVVVDGERVSEIGRGVLLLLGVEKSDTSVQLNALLRKIAGMRIFEDDRGRMNLSNEDTGGEYLVVSQFTICADLRKGKRPSFEPAMKPPESEELYERFCKALAADTGCPVRKGRFGAHMIVEIENDGPATFVLEV